MDKPQHDFTEYLRKKADSLWKREQEHPFLAELSEGTLSLEAFRYYMRQDYVFLIEFCRVVAFTVAKAQDLGDMSWFAQLLDETLNTEMTLHVSFCEDFGISIDELQNTKSSPTTTQYTSYLLETASAGNALESAMAILPCSWGYAEIGQNCVRKGLPTNQPLYSKWIQMYASPEFHELAVRIRAFIDRLAPTQSEPQLDRLEEIFMESSRYEYNFWDAAYRME